MTELLQGSYESIHADLDVNQVFSFCFKCLQSILIKIEGFGKFMSAVAVEQMRDDCANEDLEFDRRAIGC